MDTATAATVNMDVVKAETSELEEVAKERRWEGGCLGCLLLGCLGFGFYLPVQAVPPREVDQEPPARQSLVGEPE